jgi:glycosyltransferase involved in cell wall biosynthesis
MVILSANHRYIHTFAICAYGRSPFLQECIESLINQNGTPSEMYISTSTPSKWLTDIASCYELPIYVNRGEKGIGQDWNFAYSRAHGNYVTIAHQDDVYMPTYAREAVRMLSSAQDSLIFFSNYGEIREDKRVTNNTLLRIKRHLLHNLENGKNANSIRVRRRAISVGCPICCPSVTFNRNRCPNLPFHVGMKCDLDWDTWERLSKLTGGFYYTTDTLMYHRIHKGSTTTALIHDDTRALEDYEMISRFWPKGIANIIDYFYASATKSNKL